MALDDSMSGTVKTGKDKKEKRVWAGVGGEVGPEMKSGRIEIKLGSRRILEKPSRKQEKQHSGNG